MRHNPVIIAAMWRGVKYWPLVFWGRVGAIAIASERAVFGLSEVTFGDDGAGRLRADHMTLTCAPRLW